uniref:2Fe-2S ferredoxin-type domain-containing protein n=1 Tax=Populus trichocarpa TaxID=3694 RepID=A0A3N7EXN8_POPTR|eukprot:XP_024453074.1 ferredoxin-1, chloroplastic isoform X3 [Populus trichocarpa]
MDLSISCHSFTSFYQQITSPNSSSLKCRCVKTTSELQTSVGVNDRTGNSPSIPPRKVTVHDRQRGVVHEFLVPENQYILHTAESQNITLPFACRHGCCTSCAVRVKSGQLRQPEALGISVELKSKGTCRRADFWMCSLHQRCTICRGNNLKFCLVDERVQGGKKRTKKTTKF